MNRRIRTATAVAAAAAAMVATMCGAAPTAAAPPTGAGAPHGAAHQPQADILSAPTLLARTVHGNVGYREVGHGSPLLLITGSGSSMDAWAPDLVDALAAHHTVVVMDNAGVGQTSPLPAPLTISAMADQTSALISTLRLHRPAVLGWSLGGMVAQALAVRHPGQVRGIVLAATQSGTGAALPIPAAAAAAADSGNPAEVLSVLFPADQLTAARAYGLAITQYPGYYQAPVAVRTAQEAAIQQWMTGADRAGRHPERIHVPVLVADGASDALDPAPNATVLARSLRHAHPQVLLYPDAGHAFLFQDAPQFTATIEHLLRSTTGR
ncbi:alpha/beta fold hydrolase [Streptacidiphilus sp. N1-12]|uniref:Alpha/beta fold hydrolase n=2 Tax=Streptacidiphilus alkalitolerans TaxID=3342712 RepID=A0ABV6WSP8_9ACTN